MTIKLTMKRDETGSVTFEVAAAGDEQLSTASILEDSGLGGQLSAAYANQIGGRLHEVVENGVGHLRVTFQPRAVVAARASQ